MKTLYGLAIGAFALAAATAVTPALADGHGGKLEQQVKAKVGNADHAKAIIDRRKAMRALSGNMKIVVAYLKKNEGGAANVQAAAAKIQDIARSLPAMFPAGTGMAAYEGVTGAKPEVFSDSAGFQTAANKLASLAGDLAKAASAQGANKGQIGGAFGPVGKVGCGGCHRTYRAKLN